MPDPLVAAAEALLKAWAPDEEVPLEQWFEEMEPHVTALRAALAEHRQRDERAEAAVAFAKAWSECRRLRAAVAQALKLHRQQELEELSPLCAIAGDEFDAARRRWAEVEGRTT